METVYCGKLRDCEFSVLFDRTTNKRFYRYDIGGEIVTFPFTGESHNMFMDDVYTAVWNFTFFVHKRHDMKSKESDEFFDRAVSEISFT